MPATLGLSLTATLASTLMLGPPSLPEEPAPAPAPAAEPASPDVDAPIVVVTAPPAPAPEPAPIVVVTAPPAPAPEPPAAQWGPSADTARSQPVAPPPLPAPVPAAIPRRPLPGIGLMISGAALFTAGLSVRIGRVDMAMTYCDGARRDADSSVTECFDYYDPPYVDGGDFQIGMLYGSSMVLTMIGSGALGQRQAWDSTFGGARLRNPNSRYVTGAVFTGLGIASIASHFALVYTDAKSPCTTYECNVQRRAAWIAASDVGAFGLNVGFANFAWAGNYKRNLARYRKFQQMQVAVSPAGAPGSVGASISGRF